ncbi:MAG: CBS domain-containing protein [Candidatus Eremiobacteraeota bacterium]|nr:CBS domain-containing protein [Candidatus Eremiobacteraeota bacterium]
MHDRELLVAATRGEVSKRLRELMRPVKAIPETKKVDELIREMRAEKVSVAIVVDEYGGTAGLVTMEDLLEEIVGEIMDEYDEAEHDSPAEIKQLADGDAVVDARMRIDEVNEELGLHLPTEDYESIGGYAFGQFGRVPLPGDEISVEDGVSLVVEETAGRRLRSVRIKKAGRSNGAATTANSQRTVKPSNGPI